MIDAEDAKGLLALMDEKVFGVTDKLMEVLEEYDLADEDGELDSELDEIFEDLTSAQQKKVEQAIRRCITQLGAGLGAVNDELNSIDDALLGEDDDDVEEEDDEDDDADD